MLDPNLGCIGGFTQVEQQAVEISQFAALAFPTHPDPFGWIPLALTVE